MDLSVALPASYWHDILDALSLAAELREQTSFGCKQCGQPTPSRGPCQAHLPDVIEAEQLYWVQRQVLTRLAQADPVTFVPAVVMV